jgi:hypothetical protein
MPPSNGLVVWRFKWFVEMRGKQLLPRDIPNQHRKHQSSLRARLFVEDEPKGIASEGLKAIRSLHLNASNGAWQPHGSDVSKCILRETAVTRDIHTVCRIGRDIPV